MLVCLLSTDFAHYSIPWSSIELKTLISSFPLLGTGPPISTISLKSILLHWISARRFFYSENYNWRKKLASFQFLSGFVFLSLYHFIGSAPTRPIHMINFIIQLNKLSNNSLLPSYSAESYVLFNQPNFPRSNNNSIF